MVYLSGVGITTFLGINCCPFKFGMLMCASRTPFKLRLVSKNCQPFQVLAWVFPNVRSGSVSKTPNVDSMFFFTMQSSYFFGSNLEPQRITDMYKQIWMVLFETTLACSCGIIFKVVNLHFSDVLWAKTQAARCHRVVLRAKKMGFRGESKSSTASSKITGGSGFLGLTYFSKKCMLT